jgi:hypothetical protein
MTLRQVLARRQEHQRFSASASQLLTLLRLPQEHQQHLQLVLLFSEALVLRLERLPQRRLEDQPTRLLGLQRGQQLSSVTDMAYLHSPPLALPLVLL